MSVATLSAPLRLISGKEFGHSWEIAQSATGPADALDAIGAVEFRMKRQDLPEGEPVVWSLASGHFEIVGTEMVLGVTGDETDALMAGSWRFLLSYGATEAETPLVMGLVSVSPEP